MRRESTTAEELERFRIAIEDEMGRTSLRAVARKVGMSPTGLQNFLDGTRPYGQTEEKLRHWYYGNAGVHRTPPELIAAQLRQYVVTLPQPNGGIEKLLAAVDSSYREAGMCTPEWVTSVRALVA